MFKRMLDKVEPLLRKAYYKLFEPPPPNLLGDRQVEYSWVAAHIPERPGFGLDLGCGFGWMGLLAARRGFSVTCVDLRDIKWPYVHKGLTFRKQDAFELIPSLRSLDLVILCSAIEHFGLSKRYAGGAPRREDADIRLMRLINGKLNDGGRVIITLPVGIGETFFPWHRVYDAGRLAMLFEGFDIGAEEYWAKIGSNDWQAVGRETAMATKGSDHYYALGLFVLQKKATR